MKTIAILLIGLFMIGCEQGETRQFETSDKNFQSLIQSFKIDHKSFTGKKAQFDVTINFFPETPFGILANCYTFSTQKNEILVHRDRWFSMSAADQKALIYHELGHCALGYDFHKDDVIETSQGEIKGSIMNKSSINTLKETEIDEFYLAEFFSNDITVWQSLR